MAYSIGKPEVRTKLWLFQIARRLLAGLGRLVARSTSARHGVFPRRPRGMKWLTSNVSLALFARCQPFLPVASHHGIKGDDRLLDGLIVASVHQVLGNGHGFVGQGDHTGATRRDLDRRNRQ